MVKKDRIRSNSTKNKIVSDDKKRFFIDTIAKFCDKCGNAYTEKDIQIVQETGFSSIIHFSCPNCKSTHIATFIRPIGVSSRMPVNTDLFVEEISKFASYEKISLDQVLDTHKTLENSDSPITI